MSKLRTLVWFAQRPQYLGHAIHLSLAKFNKNYEKYRPASTEWAKQRVVSHHDLSLELNIESAFQSFANQHRDTLEAAKRKELDCPIQMGGEGALALIYALAKKHTKGDIVETGVAYGWSSLALLLALDNREATLHSIDLPYIQRDNDQWVGCIVPDGLRDKWRLYRGSDRMLLAKVLINAQKPIFLFHYDSDKTYQGRMWAFHKVWPHIASGGYLVSDDIQDNFGFRDFSEQVGCKPYIMEWKGKYVGVIQKS